MIDRSLWLLTLTRFRLFFREPSAVFWSFGFPILLSIALGIAFREKPPEPASAAAVWRWVRNLRVPRRRW